MNTTKQTVAQGKNKKPVRALTSEAPKAESATDAGVFENFGTIGYTSYVNWILSGKPANAFEMNG